MSSSKPLRAYKAFEELDESELLALPTSADGPVLTITTGPLEPVIFRGHLVAAFSSRFRDLLKNNPTRSELFIHKLDHISKPAIEYLRSWMRIRCRMRHLLNVGIDDTSEGKRINLLATEILDVWWLFEKFFQFGPIDSIRKSFEQRVKIDMTKRKMDGRVTLLELQRRAFWPECVGETKKKGGPWQCFWNTVKDVIREKESFDGEDMENLYAMAVVPSDVSNEAERRYARETYKGNDPMLAKLRVPGDIQDKIRKCWETSET